ncbi:MAG: crossover junction endodeoxyribonuclease RuvC [Planctomycetes bacterium]|nr:crossover junction endodeoxyribonuclease RuvC [Planctomycetota bacterium]
MAVVRILGIDPGTLVVGFGCLEVETQAPVPANRTAPLAMRAANVMVAGAQAPLRVVEMGVLRLGGRSQTVATRLASLAEQLASLLDRLAPGELALEEAFFGKSVQSALRIGEARGVVLAVAAQRGLPIHEFPPARVKRCIAGRGGASKETVAAMLGLQIAGVRPDAAGSVPTALPPDATDALAVALTRAEMRRSPLWRGQSGAP